MEKTESLGWIFADSLLYAMFYLYNIRYAKFVHNFSIVDFRRLPSGWNTSTCRPRQLWCSGGIFPVNSSNCLKCRNFCQMRRFWGKIAYHFPGYNRSIKICWKVSFDENFKTWSSSLLENFPCPPFSRKHQRGPIINRSTFTVSISSIKSACLFANNFTSSS